MKSAYEILILVTIFFISETLLGTGLVCTGSYTVIFKSDISTEER